MRQQEKVIIWPAYFDSGKSRKDGRRVPRALAVSSPRVSEVKEAAERLSLPNEIVAEVGYPKTPGVKTGMLLVKKKGSKNQTIAVIAKELLRTRSAAVAK